MGAGPDVGTDVGAGVWLPCILQQPRIHIPHTRVLRLSLQPRIHIPHTCATPVPATMQNVAKKAEPAAASSGGGGGGGGWGGASAFSFGASAEPVATDVAQRRQVCPYLA